MTKRYEYFNSCVGIKTCEIPCLDKMIDEAREVSYRTMISRCDGLLKWAESKGYQLRSSQGLTLKNDFYVSYNRSKFNGKKCYYLSWSAIEFIWTEKAK